MSLSIKHQAITLEINDVVNRVPIMVHQGDSGTRFIDCTITDSGTTVTLESQFTAIIKASNNGVTKAINGCKINGNTVEVALTDTMLDTPGELLCELTIQDGAKIVTTQRFTVIVVGSAINSKDIVKAPEYLILTQLLKDVAEVEANADKVQNLVDNISSLESVDELVTTANNANDFTFVVAFNADDTINNYIPVPPDGILGAGVFTNNKEITTAFISCKIKEINGATFTGCTNLRKIYVNQKASESKITSSYVPDTATLIYRDSADFVNVNYFLASAITNLSNRVSTILSDTPSDTTTFSGNKINEMVGEVKRNKTALDVTINSGKVFGGVIGSTITINTSQYWHYACINVEPKSTIRVTTSRNANTGIDGYVFFTDDNDIIISKEIPATDTEDIITKELIVPDNATKMYVRAAATYASQGIKAVLLETIDLQTQINTQQSRIDIQQEEVTTLNSQIGEPIKKETALDVTINSGKVFDGKIGSTITIKTSQYWAYACVNVTPKSIIKVTTSRNANTGVDGYVFFTDDNDIIISKEIPATDVEDIISKELIVPDNATKMYVRNSGRYDSNGIKAVLITDYPVYDKIADLENDIDEIENKISDPLPSYYTTEWLNAHYSAIREQAQVLHGVSFAFVTDLHFPSNALNSKYLIKNILDNTNVPFALCGGDFPGAYGTQEACDKTMGSLIDYQNTIGKDRFLSTRGNHDFSIRTSETENTGYTAPVAKTYDAIVRNSEFAVSSIQAGKFYYYIDIPAQKTRIFMLCSCDTQASETTPWGINYNVSQAQIDWLLKKMQEKDGWYYIFISHIPADPAIESYNSSQDELHNIMLALKNKTTYGDVDFSTSNNTAVCHITGHNHRNQSNVDNNFLSISTTCDAYYGDDGDGAKKGTLTEQAIDVFTIDYDSGTIQTHRVGRGSNRSWNY